MALNKREWELISHSVITQRHDERVQQQALFRLFDAVERRDSSLIARLVEHGVPLDAPLQLSGPTATPLADQYRPLDYPFDQISAMGWAAFRDDVDGLELLYRHGADPSFPGPTGRDPLWMAMWANSVHSWDWIKNTSLSSPYGVNWSLRTADGHRTTRLMDAVIRRNLNAARDIVGNVDLHAVDYTGRTALHHNLLQDPYTDMDIQIARLLIEYGAPVNVEDHEGVAPAALAATPEQEALMDRAMLNDISQEAHERAAAQRQHLDAQKPAPMDPDPSEPQFPQIQKPVKFKKPFM